MKASDFNLQTEMSFDPKEGITTFRDTRLLIFDATAMGLLRQSVLEALGWEGARRLFLRFGFQNGFADFMQMRLNFDFDSEMDLLASGPVIHTWEGIVQATPTAIDYDREAGTFAFTGVWRNSYEAQQHLCYNDEAPEPTCWSLMGYASGWCTGFFGKPLLAIEPTCMGMGHEHCGWDIRPPEAWGTQAKPYLEALSGLL